MAAAAESAQVPDQLRLKQLLLLPSPKRQITMLLQCYNKAASASLGAAGELLIAVSLLVRGKREEILLVLVRKILSYSVVILSM